ncbi:protease complex subunit PrcB family protein [Bacillus sp. M6-12]|uniref:protease complex subunit PrcB family protein n=1 Tax=Bacillus sp. M6-12 TaxID=2054166 RepID=UPI0015E0DC0B|nr:protease complex subunit PrcB family protein [Bacillus sp. M6-12]
MKNKAWIGLGIVVALLLVAFFVYNGTKDNAKDTVDKNKKVEPIAYEILDDSVQLDKEVDKWLDENLDKDGFYTKKTDKEIFVLISGGKQKTTGYGISLNAVKQEGVNVNVEYEVLAPAKNAEVETKETNPHMVLRVASKEAKVEGKIAPLEVKTDKKEKTEEGK